MLTGFARRAAWGVRLARTFRRRRATVGRWALLPLFASRTETQGLVLLESLAVGVPVVSTAVLGTKEVLREARGAIVVAEDVAEFSTAVTRVLTEPALRAALA
jgi:glycosyltransferase involved in cell wall biosynthesis